MWPVVLCDHRRSVSIKFEKGEPQAVQSNQTVCVSNTFVNSSRIRNIILCRRCPTKVFCCVMFHNLHSFLYQNWICISIWRYSSYSIFQHGVRTFLRCGTIPVVHSPGKTFPLSITTPVYNYNRLFSNPFIKNRFDLGKNYGTSRTFILHIIFRNIKMYLSQTVSSNKWRYDRIFLVCVPDMLIATSTFCTSLWLLLFSLTSSCLLKSPGFRSAEPLWGCRPNSLLWTCILRRRVRDINSGSSHWTNNLFVCFGRLLFRKRLSKLPSEGRSRVSPSLPTTASHGQWTPTYYEEETRALTYTVPFNNTRFDYVFLPIVDVQMSWRSTTMT